MESSLESSWISLSRTYHIQAVGKCHWENLYSVFKIHPKSTISPYLHDCYPGPSHHHLLPRPLQKHLGWLCWFSVVM